jgi:hypothetical protein
VDHSLERRLGYDRLDRHFTERRWARRPAHTLFAFCHSSLIAATAGPLLIVLLITVPCLLFFGTGSLRLSSFGASSSSPSSSSSTAANVHSMTFLSPEATYVQAAAAAMASGEKPPLTETELEAKRAQKEARRQRRLTAAAAEERLRREEAKRLNAQLARKRVLAQRAKERRKELGLLEGDDDDDDDEGGGGGGEGRGVGGRAEETKGGDSSSSSYDNMTPWEIAASAAATAEDTGTLGAESKLSASSNPILWISSLTASSPSSKSFPLDAQTAADRAQEDEWRAQREANRQRQIRKQQGQQEHQGQGQAQHPPVSSNDGFDAMLPRPRGGGGRGRSSSPVREIGVGVGSSSGGSGSSSLAAAGGSGGSSSGGGNGGGGGGSNGNGGGGGDAVIQDWLGRARQARFGGDSRWGRGRAMAAAAGDSAATVAAQKKKNANAPLPPRPSPSSRSAPRLRKLPESFPSDSDDSASNGDNTENPDDPASLGGGGYFALYGGGAPKPKVNPAKALRARRRYQAN